MFTDAEGDDDRHGQFQYHDGTVDLDEDEGEIDNDDNVEEGEEEDGGSPDDDDEEANDANAEEDDDEAASEDEVELDFDAQRGRGFNRWYSSLVRGSSSSSETDEEES